MIGGGAAFFYWLDWRVMTCRTCPDGSLGSAILFIPVLFTFPPPTLLTMMSVGVESNSKRNEMKKKKKVNENWEGQQGAESVQLKPG